MKNYTLRRAKHPHSIKPKLKQIIVEELFSVCVQYTFFRKFRVHNQQQMHLNDTFYQKAFPRWVLNLEVMIDLTNFYSQNHHPVFGTPPILSFRGINWVRIENFHPRGGHTE